MRRATAINLALTLATGLGSLGSAGCTPTYPNAVVNSSGIPVRLSDITAITSREDLNEDQKKQALRGLGITDEPLLNILVAGQIQ